MSARRSPAPRRSLALAGAALALCGVAAIAATPHRFPVAPPPAHTGGFGEPTCEACHEGNAVNDPAGAVELRGLPATGWEPGRTYDLTIVVRRPGMARGGFEASARLAGGADSGRQAGAWQPPAGADAPVAVTTERGVAYLHHTDAGAAPSPDSAAWTVRWTAPAAAAPVVFHVSANAANGDGSMFDDYVYARGFVRAGRK